MILRVPQPIDPRTSPIVALRRLMPMLPDDAEEREERRLLRRLTIREAVQR